VRPLILGFSVSGTGKSILLRGIGPGLKTFTTSPFLPDPFMDFYAGPTLLAHNDNWAGTSTLAYLFQRYGAFPLESTSKDAALKMSVTARSYTTAVNGGDAGIAQAELYDTDSSSAPTGRFSRLSALAQVGTGSGILTAGMVIKGDKGVRVLMRAIGPSLTGVTGALQNPVLSLYRSGVLVQRNDNWGGSSTLTSVFTQTGASSLSPTSKDSAMTATLLPGVYSATVAGVYSSVGAARFEVFTLP